MVVRDDELKANQQLKINFANPWDRLAAQIADLVLLVPLTSLAMAGLKKQILWAQVLELSSLQKYYSAWFIFTFLFLYGLYHFFFLATISTTPGKYFFDLKVVNIWDEKKVSVFSAFVHSAFMVFEIILLIPLTFVFWDKQRRFFHDKVADTKVVAKKPYMVSLLVEAFQRSLARSFIVSCFLICGFLFFFKIEKSKLEKPMVSAQANVHEKNCKNIDEFVSNWKGEESRLTVSMALFSAGELGADCLEEESDQTLWSATALQNSRERKAQKALAYLAQAFVTMDNGVLSNRYFEWVCQGFPKSEACRLAGVLANPEKISDDSFGVSWAQNNYSKIWLIKNFYAKGDLWPTSNFLKEIKSVSGINHFLSEYQIKVFWRMKEYSKAKKIFEKYKKNEGVTKNSIVHWYCDQENRRSCRGQLTSSCQSLLRKNWKKTLENKKESCEGASSVRSEELFSAFFDEELKDKTRFDSAYWAIKSAEVLEDLSSFFESWRQVKVNNWTHYDLGVQLYAKLIELKDFDKANSVTHELKDWEKEKLNKKRRKLTRIMKRVSKESFALKASRVPASVSKHDLKLVRKLKEDVGGFL